MKKRARVLAALDVAFDDFTFIDFGSGKGQPFVLASTEATKRNSCIYESSRESRPRRGEAASDALPRDE
jgi:hypothetical protein